MVAEAARAKRAANVEWKTAVDTSFSRMGIAPISRSAGIGCVVCCATIDCVVFTSRCYTPELIFPTFCIAFLFPFNVSRYAPPQHLHTSPIQQRRMRRKSITTMPSRKGMAAIDVAMQLMQDYVPQGGKWANEYVRKIKIREMCDFLENQVQKFHIELAEIVKTRGSLPESFVDPNALFWDCHLEEVGADICQHLMEVDWLPEAAKPILRQAHLSISEYANHIRRQTKQFQNREMGDVGQSLRATIERVQVGRREKTRTEKMDELTKRRNARAKNERDIAAAKQLALDTDIRLMNHQITQQKLNLQSMERQILKEIGQKELDVIMEVYKEAIKKGKNARQELAKADQNIKLRKNTNTNSSNSGPARPSTSQNKRRGVKQLEPLNRPSTAPNKKRGKRKNTGTGGSSSSSSSVIKVNVEHLYILCSEAMKGLDKYLGELKRIQVRCAYNSKRKNQKSGERLRKKTKSRLKMKKQQREKRKQKVFSRELEKTIEKMILQRGLKKMFH